MPAAPRPRDVPLSAAMGGCRMCPVSEPDYALRLEKVENDQDNCDDCDPDGQSAHKAILINNTLVASVRSAQP